VLIWSLAGVIFVFGFTIFDHRADVFDASKTLRGEPADQVGATFKISKESTKKMEELVGSNKNIVGIAILAVDLRLNLKTLIAYYGYDKNNATIVSSESLRRLPFFNKSEDNNRQMVHLLNGEFICQPFEKTQFKTILFNTNSSAVYVCSVSLPPYYGNFSGYISLLMNTEPDLNIQLDYKSKVDILSTEIYLRDISTSIK
jgi:hypothetical protein